MPSVIGTKILVRPDSQQEMKNGIVIPTQYQEKMQYGTVVAIGKGHMLQDGRFVELAVVPGDRIMFPKYPTELKLDGQDYVVIDETQIHLILD